MRHFPSFAIFDFSNSTMRVFIVPIARRYANIRGKLRPSSFTVVRQINHRYTNFLDSETNGLLAMLMKGVDERAKENITHDVCVDAN